MEHWAEAMMKFSDAIDHVCALGENDGLSDKDMADELRKIAERLEEDI